MKKQAARREFLKQAARSLGVVGVGSPIFETLISGFLQKAYASTQQPALNPSGYYVHMSFRGAPPRWMFDSILTPDGITKTNFIQGGFGTAFEKTTGGVYVPRYHVEKHVINGRTLHLPPVWNMKVDRPFTDLLPHTAFVRGLDMEINSHPLSNARQTAPHIGGLSIHGMVADRSERPIPGIIDRSANASVAFKSKRGFTPSTIEYKNNPIANLLSSFQNYFANRSVHNPALVPAQEAALQAFESYAEAHKLTSSALPNMYDNAMELIANNTYLLNSKWTQTLAKYQRLVNDATKPKKGDLPGVYDTKISSSTDVSYKYDENGTVKLDDIRDMVSASIVVPNMAENFAIAEILLDKVTSNMCLNFPAMNGLKNGIGSFQLTHDQHNVGSMVSTMMTTLFYRAFLSCMTEFVAVLKAQGLFDSTVIHISSEFNRTPKADGSGSDHGVGNSNTTLISGMIGESTVLGNIQIASNSKTYQGTFGIAGTYMPDKDYNRPIQVNDVARTITSMLKVDDVVTNGRPLLEPQGALWVAPRNKEAKNE